MTLVFEKYFACGRLQHSFLWVKCYGCRHEQLVVFSCKCSCTEIFTASN
ncbi:MAG: hypothetical protein GXP16_03320 [Gammaproteobacteria bacterium]|nr:hypothetical protein [Gammaproteobacteria bacterium]